MAHNAPRHAAQVALAMRALETGQARTKGEATRLVGIGQTALTPGHLAPIVARSPDLRGHRFSREVLEHRTVVDGVEVTMQSALTGCADAALRTLHRVGRRADEPLTKDERDAISRAKMLIGLCKECGLWSDRQASEMPSEVADMMRRDADRMSVESITSVAVTRWNRDHGRQDGISPTALRQHHQMLTVETTGEDENPASVGEDE